MDKKQEGDKFKKQEDMINNFSKKMKDYLINIDLKKKKEKTAVILIGKTRVGKSSTFHILKGDELYKTENDDTLDIQKVKESLIGQTGDSKTKTPNIYSFSQEIDIIDTPGFDDNKNQMNDLIPQIQLQELLKSYKNILLLIVFQFDRNNRNCYREPLSLAENLFKSQEDINTMFDNNRICLIVNQVKDVQIQRFKDWLDDEINNQDDEINNQDNEIKNQDNEIKNQDNENKTNPVSKEFYKRIKSQIFYLQIVAEKHQQVEFRDNIHNFINYNRDHKLSINFKLSITEKSILQLQQIFNGIRNIFEQEINQSIQNFIEKTGKLDKLDKKRDDLLQFCQFIQDEIPMQFLQQYYYQDQTSCLTQLNYEECKSKKLEEFTFLFEQNIILNLLQCLKEKQIELRQFIISNKNKKEEVWQQIISIQNQILKDQPKEQQIFNSIESSIIEFQKYSNWDRLVVFIGNPLSGKSTSINLLYNVAHKKMHFNNCLMQIHFGQIQYHKVIEIAQKDKDLIIEFQQFSQDFVVLLEYFFLFCKKGQKAFSLQLVVNQDDTAENIQLGLAKFMELNQIKNLKQFNIILNNKQHQPLIKQPNLQKLNQILQNPNFQQIEIIDGEYKQVDSIRNNYQYFQNFIINQVEQKLLIEVSRCLKIKLEQLEQQFIENCLKIQSNKEYFSGQQIQQDYQIFSKILKLNPGLAPEEFKNQLSDICNIINEQLDFFNDKKGNYNKFKYLFQFLMEHHKLFNKIQNVSSECQKLFSKIKGIMEKYNIDNFNQIDSINLLQESFQVNQNFLNESEKQSLNVLGLLYKLFQMESNYHQTKYSNIKAKWEIQFGRFVPGNFGQKQKKKNNILFALSSLNHDMIEINQTLKDLLIILKRTQCKGYESLDYWFPLSLFKGRILLFFEVKEDEAGIQNADIEMQNIKEGRYIDSICT